MNRARLVSSILTSVLGLSFLSGLISCAGTQSTAQQTTLQEPVINLTHVNPQKVGAAIEQFVRAKGETIESVKNNTITSVRVIHRTTTGDPVLAYSTVYSYSLHGDTLTMRSERLLVDRADGSAKSYELREAPVLQQEADELRQIASAVQEQ